MKRIYLSSTKWFYFLTELPLLAVLTGAILFNGQVTSPVRLYPMITVFIGLVIFDFLYFFRLVRFSYEDIRTIGRFSSRDKVLLVTGKTLVLTQLPHHKLRLAVMGNDGEAGLSWLQDDEPQPFCQLRAIMVGGKDTALRILAYYKMEGIDAQALFAADTPYELQTDMGTLSAATVNERRELRLTFAVSFDTDGTVIEDEPRAD